MTSAITALIDTYNHERYIEQALVSVLEQGLSAAELEIVVVDDGSTDKTASIIQKFVPRVKLVRKKNGGQASAFNAGFAEARGEIVAFLDADDYWLSGKLRRVMDEFEKDSNVGMVHHRLREADELTGEVRDGVFFAMSGNLIRSRSSILHFNPTPTSSLAFRRTVLEKILPMPERITIQADGYIQAVAPFVASVAAIDECLGVYRIHGENLYFLTHTERDMERRRLRAETLQAVVEGMKHWFARRGYDKHDPVVRAVVSHWTTLVEREEFALARPSRVRFFRHLWKAYRNYYPVMSWRLRAINYCNAVGALIVGYENFPRLDEHREKVVRWVRGEP